MSDFVNLRVIDLGSPFFFGVGRDMTDDERARAERNGRFDNPPMSVLGITEGMAGVDGKPLAHLFAAAPDMLAALERCLEVFINQGWDDDLIAAKEARAAISKAKGEA
jgi:hypothetical protein